MFFMFPILLFGFAVYDSFAHFELVTVKLLHYPLLTICVFLLIADLFGKRDPTRYWAFMFIVCSSLFSIFCFVCLSVTQLQIGCWSFSAATWQITGLIALDII